MPETPNTPHLAFPFRRENGKVAVVQQDSTDHVMSCAAVVASCPQGARVERPDFGWPFPEFRPAPLEADELQAALSRFEPRARYVATEHGVPGDLATRVIPVEVQS